MTEFHAETETGAASSPDQPPALPPAPPPLPEPVPPPVPEPIQAIMPESQGQGTLPDLGWGLLLIPVLVILADWFFYDRQLGWTLGAYGALLALAVIQPGGFRSGGRPAWLLGAGFLGLCARCVVEPGWFSLILALLFLVSLAITLRDGWQANALTWVFRWRDFLARGGLTVLVAVPAIVESLGQKCCRSESREKLLRAWLIPLLLSVVFIGLFAGANPIIAKGLGSLWNSVFSIFDNFSIFAIFLRLLFWFCIGASLWILLYYRAKNQEPIQIDDGIAGDCFGFLTPAVIRRALVMFNVIFAIQTGMDLWYLWGGAALPQGLTYAEYAQRGAYPLIATALLAAAFVLVTFRAGVSTADLRIERRLVYVWLLQNVFLVVSVAWRLWLYVNVYSLTRLRLAAGIWMVLVACGLLWILVRILNSRSNLWLVNVNTVTLAVVLYACAWIGIDPWVASFNVRHCAEINAASSGNRPAIDLGYLRQLGYDALPALLWLEPRNTDPSKTGEIRDLIDESRMELDRKLVDWRGWTWQRGRLRAELQQLAAADLKIQGTPKRLSGKILAVTGPVMLVQSSDPAARTTCIATAKTACQGIERLAELKEGYVVSLEYLENQDRRVVTSLTVIEKPPPPPPPAEPKEPETQDTTPET